jgi:hypothetical protein
MLAMTADWQSTEVTFECAGIGRTDDVLDVLDEAAGWLNALGLHPRTGGQSSRMGMTRAATGTRQVLVLQAP